MTTTEEIRGRLEEWNARFERLHTAKEDAFWRVHMGCADDMEAARRELADLENACKRFLSDPAHLAEARRLAAAAAALLPDDAPERVALLGWRRTFAAHVVESAEARMLEEELAHDEQRLLAARAEMTFSLPGPDGADRPAGSVELGVRLGTDPDEGVRRAAWEEMRRIERHVLERGFLELVRQRNRFGRLLGGEDFYDAQVRRTEGMTKAEVFAWLDDLEARTRPAAEEARRRLLERYGDAALRPWNVRYLISGDLRRERDPYFPFREALGRWMRAFSALGIEYRGATLVLDLLDREGKYDNGFMHGPVVAWRRDGVFRPARIQFSANALPGVVGSGERATETLFHEGGHAAHFANIDMPAPCFGQEFAPSSVALAETQSMFLDALLSDAAYLTRHARDREGRAMPFDLVARGIARTQPFAALEVRGMLAVCYAERAIYEIPDEELTPERVLEAVRAEERRVLLLQEGAGRPTLSVPHLLSNDSSAYYHGYVLAEMAVAQTRRFFCERDGSVVDNPAVGPHLRDCYWREGNLRPFGDFVERATGRPLDARALAERVARDVEAATEHARRLVAAAAAHPAPDGAPTLGARIRVVHGREVVAEGGDGGLDDLGRAFARWIDGRERAASAAGKA